MIKIVIKIWIDTNISISSIENSKTLNLDNETYYDLFNPPKLFCKIINDSKTSMILL